MAHWKPNQHEGVVIPAVRRVTQGLGYAPKIHLYTLREVGVMLRHSVAWVRKQIKSGKLHAVFFGGQYFVHHLEVVRWMGMIPRASSPLRRHREKGK